MLRIVDYGLGNIGAFVNLYTRMNVDAKSAKTAAELDDADKIILPGVGAFDRAMALLNGSGMREALQHKVSSERVPVLGVCVGMQILAESSDEGNLTGLGWVPGKVRAFRAVNDFSDLPLPHMGWNDVTPQPNQKLFDGLHDAKFYFLHSYFFDCEEVGDVAATASYGIDFSCAVRHANVYGVQFHPEKSHHYGAALLKNFAEL